MTAEAPFLPHFLAFVSFSTRKTIPPIQAMLFILKPRVMFFPSWLGSLNTCPSLLYLLPNYLLPLKLEAFPMAEEVATCRTNLLQFGLCAHVISFSHLLYWNGVIVCGMSGMNIYNTYWHRLHRHIQSTFLLSHLSPLSLLSTYNLGALVQQDHPVLVPSLCKNTR